MNSNYIKIFIILLMSLSLSKTQTKIIYSHEISDIITYEVKSSIVIIHQDVNIILVNDTTRKVDNEEIQLDLGNYILFIKYIVEENLSDSLEFPFEIDGLEKRIELKTSLDKSKGFIKENDRYVQTDSVIQSYLSFQKYYDSKNVDIQMEGNNHIGESPIFQITNNSAVPIYGEFLSGYFWGTLWVKDKNEYVKLGMGTLDLNFKYREPLNPDSSTFATVGSFAKIKLIFPGEYKFIVHYLVKETSLGYSLYKIDSPIKWWVQNRVLYELECNFNALKNN